MKKFLFETVLLFSLAALAINYINNLDKPPRVKQILNIEEKLGLINLGTSHGNNFNLSGLTLPSKSLHRAGNTLYYDLQNYKFVREHLADSAIILIPVSYFAFGLDENRADKGADKSFVNEFYEYLPSSSIYDYSAKREVSLKINRIQKNFRSLIAKKKKTEKKVVAKKLSKKPAIKKPVSKKPVSKKPISKKTTTAKKKKKKVVAYDTLAQAKMLKDFAIKRVVHHKKIGTFISPEINLNYLKTLIEDANQAGFRPVLITVPYYKEYAQRFGDDWLAEHYDRYIAELSSTYSIPYLDYGIDNRFSFSPELYKNSDHLNRQGIVAFNKILFADLIRLGLITGDELRQKKKK